MKGKTIRVLVTGGKGSIGSHLVNYLRAKGHWVRSVDIKKDCFLKTNENSFVQGDLRKPEITDSVTKDVGWIFNLAANMGGIGFITSVKTNVMRDNVRINTNILEACRKNDVKRLVVLTARAGSYNPTMETRNDG